jgi:HD superfamily phosphohydrolase
MKTIKDPIHGIITISNIALSIIDSNVFQRLKNIKQLGLCYQVFPSATHTRFEHSIGVYHLAREMITNLQINQPELNITDSLIELVSIAGLTHDIGHTCFSHLFDTYLIDNNILNNSHETRSKILLNYIVEQNNINLSKEEIEFIYTLINPSDNNIDFYYQIVSNQLNQIDVDKFDYIARDTYHLGLPYKFDYNRIIKYARVINNKICYPLKIESDLQLLFNVRYILHKQVYNHHAVKGIEYLVLDILKSSRNIINLNNIVENLETFSLINDNIIDILYFNLSITDNTKQLINRFKNRNHYKCFYTKIITEDINIQKFKKYIITKHLNIDINDIIIDKYIIGYRENPLNLVTYYNNKSYNIINNNNNAVINKEIGIRLYTKNNINYNDLIKSLDMYIKL